MHQSILNIILLPCPSGSFVDFLCWWSLWCPFPPSPQPISAWCQFTGCQLHFKIPTFIYALPLSTWLHHNLWAHSSVFFPTCTLFFMLLPVNKSDVLPSLLVTGNNNLKLHNFTSFWYLWIGRPAGFYRLKEHEACLLFHLLFMLMIGRGLAKGNLRRG